MVHRAFSVFLFSPEGRLLLQQRAATKITFPLIWANTCCSHPLDVPAERAMAGAEGVVNAARRKLQQELGIAPEDVPEDCFTWITRVHYAGACGAAAGGGSGGGASAAAREGGASGGAGSGCGASAPLWGEHEIDWILMCSPRAAPRLAPNPNEVGGVREFTQAELREWMRAGGAAQVSPWFAVMEASGLLYKWWDAVLAGTLEAVMERGVIHRQHDLLALAQGAAAGSVPPPTPLAACLDATHKAGVTGPAYAPL
jgi:isopentenyl-diphosphate delta-isomerase